MILELWCIKISQLLTCSTNQSNFKKPGMRGPPHGWFKNLQMTSKMWMFSFAPIPHYTVSLSWLQLAMIITIINLSQLLLSSISIYKWHNHKQKLSSAINGHDSRLHFILLDQSSWKVSHKNSFKNYTIQIVRLSTINSWIVTIVNTITIIVL